MNLLIKRFTAFTLTAVVVASGAITSFADMPSKAEIVDTGVSLASPTKLNIVAPAQNVTTTSTSYYVYGTSNPNEKLYVNGTEITDRGSSGSFGFLVELAVGNNIIEAVQSSATDTATITRVANASQLTPYTTTVLSAAFPTFDNYVPSGEDITLSCTAPSGAYVVASLNGKTVELTQSAATAVAGVPAVFKAATTMPQASGDTKNVGSVVYTMTYNGKTTTYNSAGEMYTSGVGVAAVVQNYQSAAPNYQSDTVNSSITTVLSMGMVDRVVDQNNTMYKLSMGGWVSKSAFSPLEGSWSYVNDVEDVGFESYDNVEEYAFYGSSFPGYKFELTGNTLTLTLYNTRGVTSLPIGNSDIFTNADVAVDKTGTVITLTAREDTLWGYAIEYNNGETLLVCKSKPQIDESSDTPLKGVSIVLDPGHGGSDPGAVGVSGATGANESDLTLATAIATKTLLEGLGAEVTLTREDDVRIYSNDRTLDALTNRADFLISIHYNSTTYPSAHGLEVYSYTPNSQDLAESLQLNLTNTTGAYNRGAKITPFRMALYTACPSVLIEMEFISNPRVYDKVRTDEWLYDSAVGIKNGIIVSLR